MSRRKRRGKKTDSPGQNDFDLLREQVDALQVRLDRESKPWYQQFSNWTAILAIVFSVYTLMSDNYQEIRAKKSEFREVLSELVALADKAVPDPRSPEELRLGQILEVKRRLYLEEAELLAEQIPVHITSSQYTILSIENCNDGDFSDAVAYAEDSVRVASTSYARVNGYRNLAASYCMRFAPGDLDSMRSSFQKAEAEFISSGNDFDQVTQATTYYSWALLEVARGDVELGKSRFDQARTLIVQTTLRRLLPQWESSFATAERDRADFKVPNVLVQPAIPPARVPNVDSKVVPAVFTEPNSSVTP